MTKEHNSNKQKIILGLLPYWTPLIPPLGIACLKSSLQQDGCTVKAFDANLEEEFREIYDRYFNCLKAGIPPHQRGNFYNVGHDVLGNHLMAHFNKKDEGEYTRLVKLLVSNNFYCQIPDPLILEMERLAEEFYSRLEKYILHLVRSEEPSVLGISVYRGTLAASLFAFKLVKEKYPGIITVMGGAVFSQCLVLGSSSFELLLEKTPYIDKIIIGEGELLFRRLMAGELDPTRKVYTSADINGDILDLSTASLPDFSDFDMKYYAFNSAYTSRSCPHQCSFCAERVIWGQYRKKDPAKIVDELLSLYRQYGKPLFLMCDSLLNPVITCLAREIIHREVSLYWDGYLRADRQVCSEENTFLWRRGGLYRARLGLESGSERVLNLIGKHITPAQIKAAVISLARAGIKTSTMWVVGHPGETEADFQQTLDLVTDLKDDIYEAECNPFRYFYTGQVNSENWANRYRRVSLYPEDTRELLIAQTWVLDCDPPRQEIYRRLVRFEEHCQKLGIPNPYSLNEIYKADERWQKMQENAVPSLVDFSRQHVSIVESKHIKKKYAAENTFKKDLDVDF